MYKTINIMSDSLQYRATAHDERDRLLNFNTTACCARRLTMEGTVDYGIF